MRRSSKRGLGLFGKKSRTKRHDDIIDFDELYDDEEYYREEDYLEDEDYSDDEDYPEDEDYSEEDYPEDDDYPEEDIESGSEEEIDDYERDEDYGDEDYDAEDYDSEDYDDIDYEDDYDDYEPAEGRRGRGRRGRERRRGPSPVAAFFARAYEKIKETSAVERIAAAVFILLLAGGIATGIFYKSAMNKNSQISSFADVGSTMGDVEVVGQSGLIAVADAEKARLLAAGFIEETEEEEEEEIVPDDAEGVTVQMSLTSIKSDIKIKFINSETKKLVGSVHFEVTVVNPDGTTVTYDDHDMDGIIYKKDLTAGKYQVTPKALSSEYSNYTLDTSSKTITVKDTVEMKAVDVSNEIKKESQVNAAVEDTAVETVVESQLTDTVEWVESTKTAVGEGSDGNYSYEEISKDNIVNPSSSSRLAVGTFVKLSTARTPDESSTGDSKGDDSGSQASTQEDDNKDNEPKKISLGSSSLSLKVGESGSLGVSGPSSYTCTSDNSGVATVDNSGMVTAVSAGSATITVSADGYENTSASVIVAEAEKKDISVTNSSLSLKVGDTGSIGASAGTSITYTSDNTGIATVSGDGTVTAVAEGTATIKLTAEGYNDKTVSVSVSAADKKTMTLSASSVSLKIDETVKITAAGPSSVTYKTSNDKIATVASDGTVKGIAEGTATVTVSADGYNDASANITVTKKDQTKVPMSITKITLVEGQSIKLASSDSKVSIKLVSSKTDVAAVSDTTITAKAAGTSTITVSSDGYADASVEVTVVSKGTTLKDKNGNVVYVKNSDGKYVEATYNDYYNGSKFYLRKGATSYKYTGWQTIDGKTYFFDKNGNYVTGEQVILGAKYTFGSDGALASSSGVMGIDVSKWNGNIDWAAVKNSGVNFVIIRCGYRGSSAGALIEDPKFKSNIKGAQAAGLKVGVYFFTQAVNEVEAVEEASMVISLIKGYSISYPVYLDVEASHGRGDGISASQRTANIKAFCGTIQNAGYRAGVYANKTWFTSYINTSQITNYKIWLAQYASSVTYSASRYDMWQYTSKGRVTGISGNVDMNICY